MLGRQHDAYVRELRARLVQAQSDTKAALLRHHSRLGDYMLPEVAEKLSAVTRQQEVEMACFDEIHGLDRELKP